MIKRRIRKFYVYVAQLTSKKKTNILRKKRDASAELLFCLKTNRFFFLALSSLSSARSSADVLDNHQAVGKDPKL